MSYDVPIYIFIALIVICMRQDVGRGFGGFLDLCEKIFFLKGNPGAVITPRRSSFFFNLDCFCWVSTLAYPNLFGT